MHAIERPDLPRIGVLALGAILLAIVMLLVTAARVGDIGMSSSSGSSGAATSRAARVHNVAAARSFGFTNPFAPPFHIVLPWNTATGE